jgi:YggT family protein
MSLLDQIVVLIANILTLLIIVDALSSFFVSPFHPLRQALGRVLNPIYAPVRRIIPPIGMMDFTPLVVMVIIQIVEYILVRILP